MINNVVIKDSLVRLNVCKTCNSYNVKYKICKECGCYLPIKVKFDATRCPLGKW